MLNEQRIEHLRLQIQSSQLLSDHEKADWLNLLELMNDKQLGELEEILTAPITPAPASARASTGTITPKAAPPLSHISNLPSDMEAHLEQPVIKPSPSLIKAKPAAPKPAIPSRSVPAANPIPPVIPRPAAPRPAAAVEEPPKAKFEPMNPLVLEGLDQLQQIAVSTVREHEHASVINAVQTIAQSYGYFPALQNFEASPLYTAYINAGKNRLAGRPDSTLSQAEFELVADILQAIRTNRS